jgi:hypothetical protein
LEHYAENVVESVRLVTPREIEMTLRYELPADIELNDAVENVTWTPDVEILQTYVTYNNTIFL